MFSNEIRPAINGAGHNAYPVTYPVKVLASGAFERLPVNLSADEIRAMVLELLG